MSSTPMDRSDRMVNLRDVGGLALIGGGTTRYDVLYRGDAPYSGDAHPTEVSIWPPAVVIDLRSQEEAERTGHRWPSGPVVHRHPLHDAAAPDRQIPDTLAEIYSAMVRTRAGRIAETVAIAAHADGPVFVHCAVGKDRTGVVVAVLLLAAGVAPEAVIDDYLATETNLAPLRARLRSKRRPNVTRAPADPVARALFAVSPDAIRETVATLSSWPGGPTAWLTDHGADRTDIDRWRRRLSNST